MGRSHSANGLEPSGIAGRGEAVWPGLFGAAAERKVL